MTAHRTNNWRADQAMRPGVVNRKVFGGNRTPAGDHRSRNGSLRGVPCLASPGRRPTPTHCMPHPRKRRANRPAQGPTFALPRPDGHRVHHGPTGRINLVANDKPRGPSCGRESRRLARSKEPIQPWLVGSVPQRCVADLEPDTVATDLVHAPRLHQEQQVIPIGPAKYLGRPTHHQRRRPPMPCP